MGVPLDLADDSAWRWECDDAEAPSLTAEQSDMLDLTISEVRDSPLCSCIKKGGRSAVWRYLEGAQWRIEPVRGKRVSTFFLETLEWRKEEGVGDILDRAQSFASEAASGKLFVRGTCLEGRPLMWFHLGRENNVVNPEDSVRFLLYTVERAIASMGPEALGAKSRGQFCVVVDCTTVSGAGQLPSLAFVRQAVSMLMLRYPSRLGKLFLVNTGLTVYYLWQAISLLLSSVTVEKVVVVSGTDERRQEILLRHLSAEALEGGRLGFPGAPAFDVERYLNVGGDAKRSGVAGVV